MKVRICLVALYLFALHCYAAYGQTANSSAAWEYKQLYRPADELLNHYAKEGWEIAAAAAGGGDSNSFYMVFMKREKTHPRFGTKTEEIPRPAPPPPPQKPTCKSTMAQAPVIRGLRLGMTSDELFAAFPANERQEFDRAQQLKSAELPPNYGHTIFQFDLSHYATKDRFTGISSFRFELFDGKVVVINAYYQNMPQFESNGQLMEIVTRQLGLPEYKDWLGYSEYSSNPALVCDGFKFQAYMPGGSHFSIFLADPTFTKIVEDRKKADRARKREGFKL
jgi:hypothetical protein